MLLYPPVFQPGMRAVPTPQGTVATPPCTSVVQTEVFAVAAAFFGQGLVAFHVYHLIIMGCVGEGQAPLPHMLNKV